MGLQIGPGLTRPPATAFSSLISCSTLPAMLLRQGLQFLRAYVWRVLLISVFVLLPCFWHKSIEAGDLPRPTYNAWLAQLIARGQGPRLFIQSRWDNILRGLATA